MRDLPRQLTAQELAELFSGRTAFVERLAQIENPLRRARDVARTLTHEQQLEALATHPRIGEHSAEQRGDDPEVLAELAALNRDYEEKFGFRFIVFVNGRSRAELVPVLRERLQRTAEQELETAFDELIAIARDRWSSR